MPMESLARLEQVYLEVVNWKNALQEENKRQEETLLALRAELRGIKPEKPKPVIDVFAGDPDAVTDTEQRKLYVAQVAGFHKDILGPKILNLIAEARAELEKPMQEKLSDIIRGSINALWLIYGWGEQMLGEQVESQVAEVDKQDVASLRKIIS